MQIRACRLRQNGYLPRSRQVLQTERVGPEESKSRNIEMKRFFPQREHSFQAFGSLSAFASR
jgi:hypothetical protein